MSAFKFMGGIPRPIAVKLGSTDPTVIAGDADYRTAVVWFQCTEIAGSTPALSVELYDGTTSVYLRNAKAMTAKEAVMFDEGIILDKGQYVRITAGAGDQVDVVGMAIIANDLTNG